MNFTTALNVFHHTTLECKPYLQIKRSTFSTLFTIVIDSFCQIQGSEQPNCSFSFLFTTDPRSRKAVIVLLQQSNVYEDLHWMSDQYFYRRKYYQSKTADVFIQVKKNFYVFPKRNQHEHNTNKTKCAEIMLSNMQAIYKKILV